LRAEKRGGRVSGPTGGGGGGRNQEEHLHNVGGLIIAKEKIRRKKTNPGKRGKVPAEKRKRGKEGSSIILRVRVRKRLSPKQKGVEEILRKKRQIRGTIETVIFNKILKKERR